MKPECICSSLVEAGYDAKLSDGGAKLTVEFAVATQHMTLIHAFPEELLGVPKFHLVGGHGFGKLAHVGIDRNGETGEVCIGDAASTAVNTDRPELVYRETVRRQAGLLTRLIKDPVYNQHEQLREFQAHWELLCRKKEEGKLDEITVAWDARESERLQLKAAKNPARANMRTGRIAMSEACVVDARLTSLRRWLRWENRSTIGQALALRLNDLKPAPATREDLLPWYFEAVERVDETGRQKVTRLYKKKSAMYWLVFAARIPGGNAVFAIKWRSNRKSGLPASEAEARSGRWTLEPYRVRSLSPDSLVSRGGGSLDLGDKEVLLVGCGSVGGEVAHRLTSAGVGGLTISDPDRFSEENLYRHTLGVLDIDVFKSQAVAAALAKKHAWAKVAHWTERLEQLRNTEKLNAFDLVVIAIGSQTVERRFAEYCRDQGVKVATINCWLEGYGIGGHAILVVPESKGCWHCAYVDQKALRRGLVSNLSFLQPNQIVMRNHGGCGIQFLPYSGIAASYTAAMTADLAVRFLSAEVNESSKVSWKGSSEEAKRASLEVTYRYRHFGESLQVLPLHDQHCDLCNH